MLMEEVTRLLDAVREGVPHAADRLLPVVYEELRRLAARRLAREPPGQTLQATALVHEAYLRLVGPPCGGSEAERDRWESRGHFFAAAAEAMRRILVENARRKRRLKRGGNLARRPLDEAIVAAPDTPDDLIALDEALERLQRKDPQKCALVKLRFFAGLTGEQAAAALGVSVSTADRHWAYARAWLFREISGQGRSTA
jgi:RNA polymerase sigma factor (TIGR02999 family)